MSGTRTRPKLETAVFLECRRHAREWHYHAGDKELDLCDPEDRLYINTCWNLADASTAERETAAMAAGARATESTEVGPE